MAKYTHKLIAETAKQICGAAYDHLAHDNGFHKANPNTKKFINKYWGMFVGEARSVLASMLNNPNTCERDRVVIVEALMLDRELPRNKSEIPDVKKPLTAPVLDVNILE